MHVHRALAPVLAVDVDRATAHGGHRLAVELFGQGKVFDRQHWSSPQSVKVGICVEHIAMLDVQKSREHATCGLVHTNRCSINAMRIFECVQAPSREDDVSRPDQLFLAVCWRWSITSGASRESRNYPAATDNSIPHRELGTDARRASTAGTPRALEVVERSNLLNLTQTLFESLFLGELKCLSKTWKSAKSFPAKNWPACAVVLPSQKQAANSFSRTVAASSARSS